MKPPIWRCLEVSSDATLAELHEMIQTAFMWFDCHLHEFDVRGTTYGVDDGEGWGDPPVAEDSVRLGEIAPIETAILYTYDFGDDWRHRIAVEAIELADPEASYPRCTAGRRSAPPEDIGGPGGYEHFVEAVANPGHPDHDDLVEWFGRDDFEPTYFEVDDVNRALRVT